MFNTEALFKLVINHLKKEFKIDGIVLKLVEDQNKWSERHLHTFGYLGPVPTYMLYNPNDSCWRSSNLYAIIQDKLDNLIKMIGDNTIRRVITHLIVIINSSGNDINNDYYISKKVQSKINKGLSQLDGKFFELPKSQAIKKYVEHGTKISFEFSHVYYEFSGEQIDVFLRVSESNIMTPDGDLIPTLDVIYEESDLETIIEYLNYEWPEFAEGLCWGIFTDAGLMSDITFYDSGVDYFRFYFQL